MDHAYPPGTTVRPLPPDVISAGARMVAAIHGGVRTVVLTGDAGSGKSATLGAVLAGMPGWVERVSNRMPDKLTLPRILTQLGIAATGADALARALAERSAGCGPAVLVVDDAHTMTPDALSAVARAAEAGGDGSGTVLILAGEPALLGIAGAGRLAGPYTLTVTMSGAPSVFPVPGQRPWLAGFAVLAALGVVMVLRPDPLVATLPAPPPIVQPAVVGVQPEPAAAPVAAVMPPAAEPVVLAAPVALPVAAPVSTPVAAQAPVSNEAVAAAVPEAVLPPAVEPETPRAARAAASDGQRRREFDVFLNRAGRDTALMTPGAREALFREYLSWRDRAKP